MGAEKSEIDSTAVERRIGSRIESRTESRIESRMESIISCRVE